MTNIDYKITLQFLCLDRMAFDSFDQSEYTLYTQQRMSQNEQLVPS